LIALSGILAEQGPSVRAAAEAKGLVFLEQKQSGDWIVLVLKM